MTLRRLLPAALLAALLLPEAAHATGARKAGLAGNLAFEDDTDLYLFPGRIGLEHLRLDLDLGTNPTGAFLWGEPAFGFTLGAALNRDPTINNLDAVRDLTYYRLVHDGGEFPADASDREIATLLFGHPKGFGGRLSLVREIAGATSKASGEELEASTRVTGVELSLGWSNLKDSRRGESAFDTFLTFRMNGITRNEPVAGDQEETFAASGFAFSGGARAIFGGDGFLDWMALANVSLRDHSGTKIPPGGVADDRTDRTSSLMLLRAQGGPRARLGEHVTFATLATLGYASLTIDSENDAEQDTEASAFALPGLEAALEWQTCRYAALRWGFKNRYVVEQQTSQDNLDDDNDRTSLFRSTGDYRWSLGAGLRYWDFELDAEFSSQFTGAVNPEMLFSLAWSPEPADFEKPPLALPPAPRPGDVKKDEKKEPAPADPTPVTP